MKKRFIVFFAGLIIVSLMFGLSSCLSTPKLEDYKKISFSEFQKIFEGVTTSGNRPKQGLGFIVEGYLLKSKDRDNWYVFCETPNSKEGLVLELTGNGHNNRKYYLNVYGDEHCKQYHFHRRVPNYYVGEENYRNNSYNSNYDKNDLAKKIDTTKKYIIYIGFYYNSYYKFWEVCIDKIEGLRTPSEIAAIESQKKAEQEATAEAKRKAIEEEYKILSLLELSLVLYVNTMRMNIRLRQNTKIG